MKLVSVIVPVYNNEQYLEACLESIFSQSYSNIEVIVVDDGSNQTSSTKGILRHYAKTQSRLNLINQQNKGVSYSRNKAMTMAKGEYLTFVDSDDVLLPGAIYEMVRLLETSGADAVRTSYVTDRGDSAFNNRSSTNEGLLVGSEKYDVAVSILSGTLPAYVWLLMIKRSKLAGDVRFPLSLRMMEDTYFYVALLRTIDSIYISEKITYQYSENEQSASRSALNAERNIEDIIKLNGMVRLLYKNDEGIIRSMNTNHANIISNTLFIIYDQSPRSLKKILSIAGKLATNIKYRDIVEGGKIDDLRPHLRWSVKSIYNKRKFRLFLIFCIRSTYKKLTGRNTL